MVDGVDQSGRNTSVVLGSDDQVGIRLHDHLVHGVEYRRGLRRVPIEMKRLLKHGQIVIFGI